MERDTFKLDKIYNRETKNSDLEIITVMKGNLKIKRKRKDFEELTILKNKIYLYIINNCIKVFDYITLKEISSLTLPFEPINLIITELETVLLHLDSKLYFFKINIKENKLDFLCVISNICYECYLYHKKEIFILQSMNDKSNQKVMGKTDLYGNIKFYDKIKPKFSTEYIKPKENYKNNYSFEEDYDFDGTHEISRIFRGIMKDKYIINLALHYYRYIQYGKYYDEYETNYSSDVIIYNTKSLKSIFKKEYDILGDSFIKISDNLFVIGEEIFYFDGKKNKLFRSEYDDRKEYKKYENGKFFYLKDDMFGIYSIIDKQNMLFMVDLSDNGYITEIKINDELKNFSNLIYYEKNGRKYLYFCIIKENQYDDEGTYKIVRTIIK